MGKNSGNWLAFLVALVLGLAGHGALAQPYTQEGETAVARATQGIADANGDIVKFRDMTIRWQFDVLMGSPLRQFAGRYTHYDPPWVELSGVQTCFAGRRIGAFRPLKLEPQMLTAGVLDQDLIYVHTRFNMIIQPNARLSFMTSGMDRVIQHEFMVDTFSTGSEYGLSVPGSPEWDRMFQYGREGSPDNPWLTEAQAKELFAVGFTVSRIEMIEPRYALTLARASYERHFGASACGDEPARAIAEAEEPEDEGGEDESPTRPSEPETAEDRIAAMLTRVADVQQQAREEQARQQEEAQRQQEVEAAALVLPDLEDVAVSTAPAASNISQEPQTKEDTYRTQFAGIVDLIFKCPDSNNNILNCKIQFENKYDNTDMNIVKYHLTSAMHDREWPTITINDIIEHKRLSHESAINVISLFIDEKNSNKNNLFFCIELDKKYYFGSSGDEISILLVPFYIDSGDVYIGFIEESRGSYCNNSDIYRLI